MTIFNTNTLIHFQSENKIKYYHLIDLNLSKTSYISSVDRHVIPIAIACCLPSAIIATMVSLSAGVMHAPGDVSPGHIIFAPLNTNRMAPLSTCSIGKKNGYLCNRRSDGIHSPSLWRKNRWSPFPLTSISMWSWLQRGFLFYSTNPEAIARCVMWKKFVYHFIILKASFLGNITSTYCSMCGNWSNSLVRMPFWTDDFNCCTPDTFSFSSNLKWINFFELNLSKRVHDMNEMLVTYT